MVPKEELLLFDKDPEGAPRLGEYIDKLMDNLYLFSKELYDKRTMLKLVSKIRQRKALQGKIRATMPQYCEILQNWETEEMKKRNIGNEFIRGY